VRKLDIDVSCDGLDGALMLCVFEEVPSARLEFGIPIEEVELGLLKRL
jgi:hypothetical protein